MKEWYQDWFASDEYLNLYAHRDDVDADKLLELILEETGPVEDASILDAACGAGRHAINLTVRGYNVIGFDLSKSLLQIAKQNSAKKNVKVDLFCADLRRISLNKKFDLVLNLFTSFGYFTNDKENFTFIRSAYQLLNDNSYYVLDFLNAKYIVNHLIPESVSVYEDKKITELRKIHENRVVKQIIIQNKSEERIYHESVQLYSKEEIITEFGKIGFTFIKNFGDYEGSTFDPEKSKRLILFFRK